MPVRRRTLPPPEWSAPRSVSGLALEWLVRHAPVARRRGSRAELASLRARLAAAAASGDAETERLAAAALSRALAARGSELDTATKLARRALMIADEPALREELSSWFAALGEPGLAAATLKPLVDIESGERLGRLLTRIAVFLGRHGEARGAAESLAHAAKENPADPVPDELRGAIAAWAPEAVSAAEASSAYLEAARRRESQGDRAAAFEDLLRAFEIAPEHAPAAQRLAGELAQRGRVGAADEALREHARAAGDGGIAVHRGRLRDAVVDGDPLRALAAAFDAGLDRGFDAPSVARATASDESGPDLVNFDRLLEGVGLHEIVVARLELAAEALGGVERARARAAQGRICAGPVGSPERAVEAWIDGLTAQPSSEETKSLLREYAAGSGDYGPLVEALVRVGRTDAVGPSADRAACLRELVVLADQRLSDPSLALWAVRRLLAQEEHEKDEELRSIAARLSQRARLQDESLASTRVQLAAAKGAARIDMLRIAAVALRGRPDDADEYIVVLEELAREVPDERAWRYALERVFARLGRFDALEGLYQRDLERKLPKAQHERARLGLSARARARGDVSAALEVLAPLLTDTAVNRAGWATIFALASQAGRRSPRARALTRIASASDAPLAALLASVAAEIFLADGDVGSARKAAEQACHADSSGPRSIAALARATQGQRDRVAAVALERAAGVVLPRAAMCRMLAETFDVLGEPGSALAWTQRGLALRPGDRATAGALLERVSAAGDPARIADALAWLLAQPEPLTELVPRVCKSICRLAELDPPRGAALARRALDVFGPRSRELRDAVLAAADSVGDRGLSIAVLERQLASGAPGSDRAEMLLDLARRRRHAGDADGAARSLVRALAEGADASAVLAEIDVALPARSSDGELALLEGRAECLSSLSSAELEGTARAWRELGAARWDLAGDREGAIAAWERGAALDKENGLERLARDLVTFAGHAEATARLEAIANRKRNRTDVARALAAAAGAALDGGLTTEALAIALRALEADSSRADVLAIAERAATDQEVEQLERAYDIIARGALGIYGERAAHYRAARQLERRGFRELALRHAILAFEAVPAEGVTFVLMMRLAERTGDSTEAVHAIERVASHSKSAEERAAWLRRAALVAGTGDEGKRQRVEVLLRALDANPHGETLRSLGVALTDLVRALPDEKDIAELRFTRALRAMLPRLEGPEGARVAVEGAQTALGTFLSADLAFAALTRAAESDASIDEYEALVSLARNLARDRDGAAGFLAKVTELVASPHANVAPPLVTLAVAVARAADDPLGEARLLTAAVHREPSNKELAKRAERVVRKAGDPELLATLLAAVPIEQRVATLVERAESAAASGDHGEVVAALEEARAIDRLPAEARADLSTRLRKAYRDADRLDDLETLLRTDIPEDAAIDVRIAQGRELAALLGERQRADEAIEVLDALLSLQPKNASLLSDLLAQAVAANDPRRQIEALTRLVERDADVASRLPLLRKLAVLLANEGDEAGSLARYTEILSLDERDTAALAALERDAERREDWDALADLLARRAAQSPGVDDARKVRLQRAQILEIRLGRTNEARAELESLLDETGDHLAVLTRLADLHERFGAKLRSAPLWLRASALPRDRAEAGELARKACQAYLDGGDVDSARRVFAGMGEYPRTAKLIALRVDIERRSENPEALSEALEEMALSSMDPPKARAGILVEAARAALAAGKLPVALGQAQRASRIARDSAEPQLFARLLEYRQRGAGVREEATNTLADLRAIRESLDDAQRELHAFLLAEALDVATGRGEGLRELSRVHAEIGPMPLVALGMAERLAATGEPGRALMLFDVALEGDLRELRRRGDVALSAAEAANAAGFRDRALEYLEIAVAAPETRAPALALQTELRAMLGRISDRPPPLVVREDDARPRLESVPPDSPPRTPRRNDSVPPPSSRPEPVLELRSRHPEPVIELRKPTERPASSPVASPQAEKREPAATATMPEPPAAIGTTPAPPAAGSLRASAPPKPGSRRAQTLPGFVAPPAPGSHTPDTRPAEAAGAKARDPEAKEAKDAVLETPPPIAVTRSVAPSSPSSAAIPSAAPSSASSAAIPSIAPITPRAGSSPAVADDIDDESLAPTALAAVESRALEGARESVSPARRSPTLVRTDLGAASMTPQPVRSTAPMATPSQAPAEAQSLKPSLRPPAYRGASGNEEMLVGALSRGSIEAGKELILQLENRSDRSHDLVGVCRRVAHLLPGDRSVLEKLYEATLADRNVVYARAIEHVLRAFDPKAAPLEPPALSEQVEQPDRVHTVLFRDTAFAATEALGLVWSGAQHMFRREPASYGVTGLERVSPSSPSPLARQFAAASRLLGMTRTPLFQRKSGETITINVALLSPPALLLTGEVKSESPALGYHIGAMLAATMPEHVLLYGAPEAQVENVLRALLAAFGPAQTERGGLAAIATLAEMLWESIPARSQRRLRELCDDSSRIDYQLARAASRQGVRRSGLFISGDLTVAVRETCAELGISTWGLDAPGALAGLCSSSPAVADLVRLATSPEYASMRWHQIRSAR